MSIVSRVLRQDEILRAIDYPALQEFTTLDVASGDIFILAAGFEDRVLACIKCAQASGKSFSVLAVNYLPGISENLFVDVISFCSSHEIPIEFIDYNRNMPYEFGMALQQNVLIKNCSNKIYIDISAMSRLLIVQTLYALRNRLDKLIVLYTESERYSPSFEEFTDAIERINKEEIYTFPMFISSGVADILFPPEFASSILQGQPSRLIVFPSFNPYQLLAVMNELQPNYLEIVHGIPHDKDNLWRRNAINDLNRIEDIKRSKNEYDVSTFDYRETLKLLLDIYNKENVFDQLTIVPTGSKLQALAIGIFRAFMEDVGIAYPTPHEFKDIAHYSQGVRRTYLLDLSFLPSLTSFDEYC